MSRNLNLHHAYPHDLGSILWSIATPYGTLYKAEKAILLDILEQNAVPMKHAPPDAVLIIDAFAISKHLSNLFYLVLKTVTIANGILKHSMNSLSWH